MAYFGVCYSPRRVTNPTADTVDHDMQIIAKLGFRNVRTYGVNPPDQWNMLKARKYGLNVGLGVWAYGNQLDQTKARIDVALAQANEAQRTYGPSQLAFDLVVGNEVNRQEAGPCTPDHIFHAMDYAQGLRSFHPNLNYRVTTCFSGTVLVDPGGTQWQKIVTKCDAAVYLTVYPWWSFAAGQHPDPGNIDPNMQWSWNNGLSQVVNLGRQVVIAEIGWPSAGKPEWNTTVASERLNYNVTKKWVLGGNSLGRAFDTYWFEMFDEPWKTNEGPFGPYFGLYDKDANPKWSPL